MDSEASREVDRVMKALRPRVKMEGLTAIASFEPQPEHRGNTGWLHGGLAATVLDHVCAAAAASALGRRAVTGRLDLRYPQPILLANGPYRVEATAQAPSSGADTGEKRMVKVDGAILDEDGKPMVEARSLFVTITR